MSKKTNRLFRPSLPTFEPATLVEVWDTWHQRRFPTRLFLALCLNLLVAPAVLAASSGTLSNTQAYAIALLGLVTAGFVVYLFMVMFQPERF
jgi:K+-transporting ATPase KdpF subunit